jgi:hypothetical protein
MSNLDGDIGGTLNIWQVILLGDFIPDLHCPYPGGTEHLARNPDRSIIFINSFIRMKKILTYKKHCFSGGALYLL